MLSSTIFSQVHVTPRLSYNWANYRVFDCFQTPCPNSRSNIGLGLNASRNVYKELSIVSGINFYAKTITYVNPDRVGFTNQRLEDIQFRHFDIKLGIENSIFNENTTVGIGIQMELMYGIKDVDNITGIVEEFPSKYYFGFELTTSHKIKKFELFFDAFFNINTAKRNRIILLYHTNFQFGIGYPISL